MRVNKEDYNNAVRLLKRYNYNCLNIINRQADILSLSIATNDGMPKAPYSISDTVFKKVIKLQEDAELNKSIIEYKIIRQALELVSNDSKYIFEELYIKSKSKWDIINSGVSEATFKRRKQDLIYAVDKEYKKLSQN